MKTKKLTLKKVTIATYNVQPGRHQQKPQEARVFSLHPMCTTQTDYK